MWKILEISIISLHHPSHRRFSIAILLYIPVFAWCYIRIFVYIFVTFAYRQFSLLYARQNCNDVICVWQKQNYGKSIHNIVVPSHLHIKPGEMLRCFQQEHIEFPHATPSRIRHNNIFRFSQSIIQRYSGVVVCQIPAGCCLYSFDMSWVANAKGERQRGVGRWWWGKPQRIANAWAESAEYFTRISSPMDKYLIWIRLLCGLWRSPNCSPVILIRVRATQAEKGSVRRRNTSAFTFLPIIRVEWNKLRGTATNTLLSVANYKPIRLSHKKIYSSQRYNIFHSILD